MDADFCIEALQEALVRFGRPVIFNTDCQWIDGQFPGGLTRTPIDRRVSPRTCRPPGERLAVRVHLAVTCDPRRA